MIQVNELRVGNLLNFGGQPSEIRGGGIQLLEDGKLHIVPIPIPLTEEWLLKFGFRVKMGSVTHNHSFVKGKIVVRHSLRFGFHYDDLKLESVHQLQNLYFALTGTELTIK